MKTNMMLLAFIFVSAISIVSADALKNSLTHMLHEKDTSPIINLNQINLNGATAPSKKIRKKRSSKAIVATINSYKLIKKNADAYISQRTNGKIKDYDLLPTKQKKRLVKEMAFPILSIEAAKKAFSKKEKETIYTQIWMRKEAAKIKITNEELKGVYEILKKQAEQRAQAENNLQDNNATFDFPNYMTIAPKIKAQIIEKKIVDNVIKDLEIKIAN